MSCLRSSLEALAHRPSDTFVHLQLVLLAAGSMGFPHGHRHLNTSGGSGCVFLCQFQDERLGGDKLVREGTRCHEY